MSAEAPKRSATVRGFGIRQSAIEKYLPPNYQVVGGGKDLDGPFVRIEGRDEAGWTLDEYVIPRLASGLFVATETTPKGDGDGAVSGSA